MDENEFEIEGVVYMAEDARVGGSCNGCAFFVPMTWCGRPNSCSQGTRIDGRNVIFVEKQP